jgi:hypothetical protein
MLRKQRPVGGGIKSVCEKSKTLYAMSFKNEDPNRTPEKRDSMWGCVMKTEIGDRGGRSATEEMNRSRKFGRYLSKSLLLRRGRRRKLDWKTGLAGDSKRDNRLTGFRTSSLVLSAIIRWKPIPTPSMTARKTAHMMAELRAALTPPRTARAPPVKKPAITRQTG